MSGLAALFYADWRGLVNDVRRGLRSPARLTIWGAYVVLLGFFFWSRTAAGSRSGRFTSDFARADYFMCTLLFTVALALITGIGATGFFRTRAEARFVIGSPVAAPAAIAYLQTREAIARTLRFVLSFVYLIFVFGPRHLGAAAVFADLVLVIAMLATAAVIVVPRRLLGRSAGTVCVAAGVPLAALALAPAVRDAVAAAAPLGVVPAPIAQRVLAVLPAWHPGLVLLEPNAWWLLGVVAIGAAAVAIVAAAGRDAYPELYALSLARIDRLERWHSRAAGGPPREVKAARRARLNRVRPPAGVLIFVWKSVVELGRRAAPVSIAGTLAVDVLAGFLVGRFSSRYDDAVTASLFFVIINIMVVVGVGASSTLASEVRRPLFWLSPTPLFERLSALLLARIWQTVLLFEFAAAGIALGGGRPIQTLLFALGLPVLAALLAGVGFAAFALFPSAADARGPVALLRIGFSLVILIPPLALDAVGSALFGAALPALTAAALVALIEAGALVGIAAWRLDGHVDRLPA